MPNLILFGATPLSLQAATYAAAQGFSTIIMADTTQAEKISKAAELAGIAITSAKNYQDLPLQPWLQNPEETLAISIGAPWFFDKKFLENTLHGKLLNLHGTHLPRGRGGTLFSWQIMSGQRTGMCLLHLMTEVLDAGPVVDCEEFIYPAHCRKPVDYIQCYEEKNLAFLQGFILNWLKNKMIAPIAGQPEYLSTYWPRLRSDVHGWLDWSWAAQEIERFICAFDTPYPGARCRWRDQEIILRDAWSQALDGHSHPFQWGIVTRNNGQWLNVAANGGELLLECVRDESGKSLMLDIKPGDRLYSSAGDIEQALERVVKTEGGLELQRKKHS